MKNHKITVILFLLVIGCSNLFFSCNPLDGRKTSFAIVIDTQSYSQSGTAVDAYRNLLESEGLYTYLLVQDWKNPHEIREQLMQLYNQNPPLEGAVFIGDIPIPMIRNAQHLTSAFKLDPVRFPFHRSSVPSDRFYDDFHMEFEYLHVDPERPLFHYYNLKPESVQKVQTSIYSGRIKPLVNGKDKYQQISDYLNKVVAARSQPNALDHAISFTGHGYNSGCMVAWASEKITMQDQLPGLFKPGASFKYMFFLMEEFSKFQLMNELQRPELDMALLSHHGSPTMQYLDGLPNVSAITPSIANVRHFLRSKLTAAKERGADLEETKQYYMNQHGVPRSWFDDTFDPQVVHADSVFGANMDISIADIATMLPQARFVKFDACFNGAFNQDMYVAGSYIFGDGGTLVTMANSVNVLQDNWPTEMIGLLGEGVRIGNWARHIHYLENHIIGDPTYYFNSESEVDYNARIVRDKNKTGSWVRELNNKNPDVQALALTMLYNNEFEGLSGLLKETFVSSSHASVRMQSLLLLNRFNDNNYYDALKMAVSDPAEIIRRMAARMIGDSGSEELLPALVSAKFNDRHSKRVMFNARNSFAFMQAENAKAEMAVQFASSTLYNKESYTERLDWVTNSRILSDLEIIQNPAEDQKKRLAEIRTLRNYTYHFNVPEYVKIAANPRENKEIRLNMIEALGWFTHSYNKQYILDTCTLIIDNPLEEEDIRQEALRTINRLNTL